MDREYFMTTGRLCFSKWNAEDKALAGKLWGDPEVTRYICASGIFSAEDIAARLELEIKNGEEYGVQYWPVFTKEGEFAGCCGLRPRSENVYEIGCHLLPGYWKLGYASEASKAVIAYAFDKLGAEKIFAGHNPKNTASRRTLTALSFDFIGEEYYAPTGLMHPAYEYPKEKYAAGKSAGPVPAAQAMSASPDDMPGKNGRAAIFTCPKCHKQFAKTDLYCPFCGEKLWNE